MEGALSALTASLTDGAAARTAMLHASDSWGIALLVVAALMAVAGAKIVCANSPRRLCRRLGGEHEAVAPESAAPPRAATTRLAGLATESPAIEPHPVRQPTSTSAAVRVLALAIAAAAIWPRAQRSTV